MENKEIKRFFRAKDIAADLDCSEALAYRIIRELNAELKQKGFLVAAGRVPASYFLERYGVGKKP